MWVAGLAAGGALVAAWRVAGRGYVWLSAAVVALVGVGLGVITGDPLAWLATGALVVAAIAANRPMVAISAFLAATALFFVVGLVESPVIPLITGSVFLGAVTTEMMLGHWFLVAPRLPRRSLTRLAFIGAGGLSLDVVYLATRGLMAGAADEPILGWAYLGLTVMTALLIAGVVFSLREPGYSGVMAATGLSYLAVLTAFGVAVLGRMLVA
jgi:hypothetical protein